MPDAQDHRRAMQAADAELYRATTTGDPLSCLDRDILGDRKAVRLHLPLRDPVDLRRQAEILRRLANDFEVASHMRASARTVLFVATEHVRSANARLRSQTKRK